MRKGKLRFGVFVPTFAGGSGAHHDCPYYEKIDWRVTTDFVRDIEALDFDSIWISDHFMLGKDEAMFEGWTSLAHLAATTRRLVLGTFVMCNSYRNPALLAKMAATLDVLSGGRLYLGLGAGWYQREYEAYGYSFPPAPDRIAALRETITIIKQLWGKTSVDFEGQFYKVRGAVCNPKPIQKPYPPIMLGAWGRKMLKLTAEAATAWNIADDPSPEVFKEKFETIAEHCGRIGRDPDEIEKTWAGHVIIAETSNAVKDALGDLKQKMAGAYMQLPSGEITKVDPDYLIQHSIHGSPSDAVRQMTELKHAGVDHFILYFWDFPNKNVMKLFASKVMPKLR